ncbi:hypothetical protein ACFQJ5_10570 [Halomicroarcula sp. GCM10025324]|uniref:DUF7344 domain-containing protein n=1 Tax=Haloarcula TaxID=2237 RepID=UPI0023E78664|nr:hypothetical protein [Halomicroarcula sp. ZS-22-S1]
MATHDPETEQEGPLPPDVVADLLAVERRRRALEILDRVNGPVVVRELAETVLAAERDALESELPDDDVDSVREELFRDHLPKLTATGVVRYNSMVGTVELRRPEVVPDAE